MDLIMIKPEIFPAKNLKYLMTEEVPAGRLVEVLSKIFVT